VNKRKVGKVVMEEANVKSKQQLMPEANQTFFLPKGRKEKIKILLGSLLVAANVESDRVLTLLLGSGTNKGSAEADDCVCGC